MSGHTKGRIRFQAAGRACAQALWCWELCSLETNERKLLWLDQREQRQGWGMLLVGSARTETRALVKILTFSLKSMGGH